MRIWLNGDIMDASEATISPFDRGFLFGDGVYEGIAYFNGKPVEMRAHVSRLRASLKALQIPFEAVEIDTIANSLLDEANSNAFFYIQISRGCEIPRQHQPDKDLLPTVFAYFSPLPALAELKLESRSVAIRPEIRWLHCDIKSLNLLGNIMSIIDPENAGIDEVIFQRDGLITEGAKTSVFAVIEDAIVTPPLDSGCGFPILPGVMRQAILDVARGFGMNVHERAVRVEELANADEVFVSSSRRLIDAVVSIDRKTNSDEGPGDVTRNVFGLLKARVASSCGINLHSSL